jgi:hypothetical protein
VVLEVPEPSTCLMVLPFSVMIVWRLLPQLKHARGVRIAA